MRRDDNIESLRKRFTTYKNETMPVVKTFEEKGQCIQTDSSKTREEVWTVVKEQLVPLTAPELVQKPLTEASEVLLGLKPDPKRAKA